MELRLSDLENQVERLRDQLGINDDPYVRIAQWQPLGGIAMPLNGVVLGSEADEAIEEQGEPAPDADGPEVVWLVTGLTSVRQPYDVPSELFDLV